jgi:phage baseplate assembly protein gpV
MFRLAAFCSAALALGVVGAVDTTPGTSVPQATQSATQSAVGTIVKFDPVTWTLTVETESGRQSFVLSSTTTVRVGSRIVKSQALAARKGARVKMRYSDAGGKRVVESVMVSASDPARLSL